jgi:thiol-disulfide isomerase/thioredoxin/YHS domain-containing protein
MKRTGHAMLGLLLFATVAAIPNVAQSQGVQWQTDPAKALQQANATGRLVLMKFTAEWCGHCMRMERTTFADPATAAIVHRNFVPLLIDTEQHGDIAKQLEITGLPSLLIVAPDMTILKRIVGFQTSEKLIPKLNSVVVANRPTPRTPVLPAAQQQTPAAPATRNATVGSVTRAATPQPSFNGQCLTSVIDRRELITGSSAFAAEYRGQTIHFRDAARRKRFFQTPEKYWPQFDGICAVTFLETGRQVPGQLKHAAVYRDQIWLFQHRPQLETFIESPADHVALIQKRLEQSQTAGRSY